jgi:hypothetical protein
MTNEEIRKLLGGYATNNLTETERQALFEAALDDQELFDALHQEQALKELLADPLSRAQIRQVLEKPPSAARPRWWAWTAAVSAVAAVVLIVAVIRSHTTQPPQQYATLQALKSVPEQPADGVESNTKSAPQPTRTRAAAAKQAASGRRTVPQTARKDEPPLIAPPVPSPAPAAPAPAPLSASQQVQVEAQAPSPSAVPSQGRSSDAQAQSQQVIGGAINSLRDQVQSQASPAQVKGALAGALFKSNSPAVRYALLKRDADGNYQPLSAGAGLKPGDAVRLSVIPITSGYLSLSRQDASGDWKRVFPETGPGLAIEANGNYTIPASPIEVSDTGQNFRLTLAPTSMNASDKVKTRTLQLKKESPAIMQSTVDLTIGPRRVP